MHGPLNVKEDNNKTTKYRLNQQIKFLNCKKKKLNEQLYRIHLECAKQVESRVAVYTENNQFAVM